MKGQTIIKGASHEFYTIFQLVLLQWHQAGQSSLLHAAPQKLTFVQVISGPIASGLLLADGAGGLKGWQWLFIIEGLPTIVLGVWVYSSYFCINMVLQSPSDIVAACLGADEAVTLRQLEVYRVLDSREMQGFLVLHSMGPERRMSILK